MAAVRHKELHMQSTHDSEGAGILSYREKEILELVASGYTNPEIGAHIHISRQTVITHMKNIYRKLQVHSRAQAVIRAKNQGLLN